MSSENRPSPAAGRLLRPGALLAGLVLGALLGGCDREPCASRAAEIDPFWTAEHADLVPPGVVLCGGTPKTLRFDFDPEPETFADVTIVQQLESAGWVRIKQSRRKSGRKYILEKGPNTLIVLASTEKGRTQVSYEWRP